MADHPYSEEFARLEKHYSSLLAEHGDSPQAVQYRDRATHERRFEILADVGLRPDAKVLDFGCGTGAFLDYLRRERGYVGEYVGCDLSEAMVAKAQEKFPDARFIRRDVLSEGLEEDFDIILIAGVFNNLGDDNFGFMQAALKALFPHVREALAFNGISRYVDFMDEGLYYADPEQVFRFCKESLSPLVTLRHDYLIRPESPPFEFTVYVRATTHHPRPKQA